MSENTKAPIISIYGKRNVICIGRPVIRLLGYPPYICLYQTSEMDSIAIGPCEAKNHMSFKVYPSVLEGKSHSFEIKSIRYVNEIMRANNLERTESYRIAGVFLEDKNMVTFNLSEATESHKTPEECAD